jgi:dephospho-CoA kinase
MKVIVITGGIGSGKSSVCAYLEKAYGWPVYEADAKVKQLYVTHPSLLTDIEKTLGLSLRDEAGDFKPSLLASVIFNDRDALIKVEDLVFPVLSEDFEHWKSQHSDRDFVILESATILEKPQLKGMGDVTVLIDAPLQLRQQRASLRDGVSAEMISRRMDSQTLMNDISSGKVESPAQYTVINDGRYDDLTQNIDNLVKKLL